MKMILVLDNIRSAYNVGAILRTAEGFGVTKVILSGYTPATKYTKGAKALPHVLENTTAQIAKTALGAEEMVPCEWSNDIVCTLSGLRKSGYAIFGLENNLERDNVGRLDGWREVLRRVEKNREENGLDRNNGGRASTIKSGELSAENAWRSDQKLVLILGEEVEGIGDSLFDLIDWFLEIPMAGKKESFNVSVAAGIALYELLGR